MGKAKVMASWSVLRQFTLRSEMDQGWRLIVQRLMQSFLIVELKVGVQVSDRDRHGGIIFEIDLLIFDGTPEPFDENIVQRAAFAVVADLNARLEQPISKSHTGELGTLISVKNLRLAPFEGMIQGIETETNIHRIGNLPS